ncbi:hypothetical protein D9758_002602 [Tetrapyrgos nigripes]|uniref:Proline dehydrogenase n=1 Tax=Tetrapyrgos nigripes TaxID=182062 RepID=A0A8H5GQI1_9AGAR|nr:hypothetical protein D9758_002602 [Tetrapyrgos nigripes]
MLSSLVRKTTLQTSFRCFSRQFGRRHASSHSGRSTTTTLSLRRSFRAGLTGGVLAFVAAGVFGINHIRADSQAHAYDDQDKLDGMSKDSIGVLLRTYIVYSMCSIPGLIDVAPKMLDVLTSIPVAREITQAFVRITFFDQFVGGDTALQVVPLLRDLRSKNKGALFAYSIEVDEREAASATTKKATDVEPPYKRIVNEMIRCIDVAADFEDSIVGDAPTGRRTWVAVKMTVLLPDAKSLINLSSYILAARKPLPEEVLFPGCPRPTDLDVLYDGRLPSSNLLTHDDIVSLRELHSDLRRICVRAKECGVKIILDTEYSWYQPAIDALQYSLMREFNNYEDGSAHVQPLVYGTFQAYLRRSPSYLAQSFEDARKHNYVLGVKLVRGAYHPQEVAAHQARMKGAQSMSISPEPLPPVWTSKEETDKCYNECAKELVAKIKEDIEESATMSNVVNFRKGPSKGKGPRIGVLFGTHNWTSTKLILKELVRSRLASIEGDIEEGVITVPDEVTERLTLGQLFGMNDALSDYIVQRTRSNAPMVIKYVPYGALSEVMPYLSRRAIENKSVLVMALHKKKDDEREDRFGLG